VSRPSVVIGIPAFNRGDLVGHAIESVLTQTWPDLQLVISDDASTDATEEVCSRWAEVDQRVKYIRQPVNLGLTGNFNFLFAECSRADFVMMLSDDDWLDPDYVERCRAELVKRPDYVVVAGTSLFIREGEAVAEESPMQLRDEKPERRVSAYYRSVFECGAYYGLMRGSALSAAMPMPDVLANDWILVGRVVCVGKVMTLTDTHVNRRLGGTSESVSSVLNVVGGRLGEARLPHLYTSFRVWRDIVRGSPVFGVLNARTRLTLSARAALGVIDWPSLAWHLTEPSARALNGWRSTRWAWVLYARLTRALGAGRKP